MEKRQVYTPRLWRVGPEPLGMVPPTKVPCSGKRRRGCCLGAL